MRILAGDIGGTKTHLGIFEGTSLIKDEKFSSRQFSGLSEMIARFHPEKIECACFGVAGPVLHNQCKTTNLPWFLDGNELSLKLKGAPVWLINDLEATAWGVGCLKPDELETLNEGIAHPGNQAVIAAGTGLGEAGLYWDGSRHHPMPCEGGHTDFAPRNQLEVELWEFLQKKYGHVSYERLVSGPGLENLYSFMCEKKKTPSFLSGENLSRQITELGLSGNSPFCREILEWFASLYGAEAGNLALKYIALGGVYIGGGLAPKLLQILRDGHFMEAFIDKGRFKKILSTIPVKIILNDNAALLGAAEFARQNKS